MHPGLKSIIVLFAILLTGCSSDIVYSKIYTFEDGWRKDDPKIFSFSPEGNAKYDMFIVLRNDDSYPYSNIFLIVDTTYPQGYRESDTLQYQMANPNGSWLGKGLLIKENLLIYKQGKVFDSEGEYKIKIGQAMRKNGQVHGIETLKGITDLGLDISKSKN